MSLTLKTVMLCALSSALREQTLCALEINLSNKSVDSLIFIVSERLKTSTPGKSTLTGRCFFMPCGSRVYVAYRRRKSASSEETRLFI